MQSQRHRQTASERVAQEFDRLLAQSKQRSKLRDIHTLAVILAVKHVAESAPRGSTLAHETPGVARHYLAKFGRTDIDSRVISDPRFDARDTRGTTYFILQRGRTYFENREELEAVRRAARKEHEVFVRGVSAAEVYVVDAALAARE